MMTRLLDYISQAVEKPPRRIVHERCARAHQNGTKGLPRHSSRGFDLPRAARIPTCTQAQGAAAGEQKTAGSAPQNKHASHRVLPAPARGRRRARDVPELLCDVHDAVVGQVRHVDLLRLRCMRCSLRGVVHRSRCPVDGQVRMALEVLRGLRGMQQPVRMVVLPPSADVERQVHMVRALLLGLLRVPEPTRSAATWVAPVCSPIAVGATVAFAATA